MNQNVKGTYFTLVWQHAAELQNKLHELLNTTSERGQDEELIKTIEVLNNNLEINRLSVTSNCGGKRKVRY